MRRSFSILVIGGLLLAGCGSQTQEAGSPPPTLPAGALPDLASSSKHLDADALAADALEPAKLRDVLAEAEFETGVEREFSGKTKTFDHVVARTIRFASAEGADAYLGWLGTHGDDLLGKAAPVSLNLPGESAVAYALVRCGSCKKELPTFFAGWRRDELVLSLLAAGSGANPDRFDALARELDGVVG